jgi:hypothetical protein
MYDEGDEYDNDDNDDNDDDDGINYLHRYIDITAVSLLLSLSPLMTIISLFSFNLSLILQYSTYTLNLYHINSHIISLIFYQQRLQHPILS